MRDLTVPERTYLYAGAEYRCVFCGRVLFAGPRGGAGVNMECASPTGCGAMFNVIHPSYRERYGAGISFFGQLIKAPARPYTQVPLEGGNT